MWAAPFSIKLRVFLTSTHHCPTSTHQSLTSTHQCPTSTHQCPTLTQYCPTSTFLEFEPPDRVHFKIRCDFNLMPSFLLTSPRSILGNAVTFLVLYNKNIDHLLFINSISRFIVQFTF